MRAALKELLGRAKAGRFALGAFNVYTLEGVRAVVRAAEALRSPAVLQIHPAALRHGGRPLVALCLEAARGASVPVAVHLDHGATAEDLREALEAGFGSVMADGSHLPFGQNLEFARAAVALARGRGAAVEAELGRLSGTEDGLTVPEVEARMTDPAQAAEFVKHSGVDALAVCVGNVHGRARGEPALDFARLEAVARAVPVPLVLHGASGLSSGPVRRAVSLGVCKFNVNTELREACLAALSDYLRNAPAPELIELMKRAEAAMEGVAAEKLRLFGSEGKASASE
jgi:tagatose 1,6-diphosphate aldolase GatY/KbaY